MTMPPITERTRVSVKIGGAALVLLGLLKLCWMVSATWTTFTGDFDAFRAETRGHFASLEKTLEVNKALLEDHSRTLASVSSRQQNVLNTMWTIQEMKDWSYQLDRNNRSNDNGQGFNVPNPEAFVPQKKPE